MSYDISLMYEDGVAEVENHDDGGTYVLGGTTEAWLNITWNYAKFFYSHLDEGQGIRWLYGKPARDTVSRLQAAVDVLGTEQDPDYWANTPGNAGYALSILLRWARRHPDAVWHGD